MAQKNTKKKQTKKPPKQTAQRAKKTASKPQKATPRKATKPQKKQTVQGHKETREDLYKKLISILQKWEKQKKKPKAKNEFRYNHNTNHMNYVYEEVGDQYKAIGLTTKTHTFGRKNMQLKDNPKKGDNGDSYVRNGSIKDNKRSFSSKTAKNYQFSKEDMANVKSKIRHHKKEAKKKKK